MFSLLSLTREVFPDEGDRITRIDTVMFDWRYGRDQYDNDGLFPGACICCAYLLNLVTDGRFYSGLC
jgi:hypothetical protein